MDGKSKKPGVQNRNVVQKVGSRKIRNKLFWSFLTLIALTLVVVALTIFILNDNRKKGDELVMIHGRIVRLSLETETNLQQMRRFEKDFLLNYEKVGIRKAKELYYDTFVEYGGKAYNTLYEIQELSDDPRYDEVAQSAIDSINEYLSTFMGTVNILELRNDKEFGELVKLRQSMDELGATVNTIDVSSVNNTYYQLVGAIQDYLPNSKRESADKVNELLAALRGQVEIQPLAPANKDKLNNQLVELDKWFTEVVNTDGVIAAKIMAYQEAASRAEPFIATFLKNAEDSETVARVEIEGRAILFLQILVGASIISILLGVIFVVMLPKSLTNQVNHIMKLLAEIEKGNFQARTEIVSNDELGVMATALNGMLDNTTALIQSQEERDSIQESIMKLLEEISALSDGDFTVRAEVTEDMTGAIADSFNAMADQFSEIIKQVKTATESVDITSEEVTRQTTGLAEKNIEQVKGVTAAVEAIEQMVKSIREVAENAQQSASVSKKARQNAQEGALAVNETSQAMVEIREQINETARSIKRLGETSLEIGNIVQIIDDIADRTSILALNASIQAAMAGDAGHGFAVVADEVQRLADSSGNSTKQIELLVKSIQTEIKDVTNRIDESIGKVVQGTKLADGAHEKLQQIEDVSNSLAQLIDAITEATTGQVAMSETISKTMEEVGEVSRESSLSSQDTASSMNILSSTARELRSAVDIFKVGEAESA